jgi:TPR repeat protein
LQKSSKKLSFILAEPLLRGSALIQPAQQSDIRATLDLGRVLRNGIGGPADPVGACAWLDVASLGGNAEARIERHKLIPILTQDKQARAAAEVAFLPSATARCGRERGDI